MVRVAPFLTHSCRRRLWGYRQQSMSSAILT